MYVGGDMSTDSINEPAAVFDLSTKTGSFSIDEANRLVQILKRVTKKHSEKVTQLIAELEKMSAAEHFETRKIEDIVSREITLWNTKVRQLGAVPKALWLVDIDSGDGFYCWQYPEAEISYWHEYRSGYANRIGLTARAKKEISEDVALVTGNA